jgi:signal peptidase II
MKKKYWILLIVFLVVIALDQSTKLMIQQTLPLHKTVEIIPGFFNLIHVRNTGGAFGIFGGEKGPVGSVLFVVASLIAVGILVVLFLRVKEHEKTLAFSLALLLSGAIGNLLDRLSYGEVIDFLDFHVSLYHWPAFNVADSAISIGIGLMALELLIKENKKPSKNK